MQEIIIEFLRVLVSEFCQRNRSQIANCNFVFVGVLDDLCAEVRTSNSAKVLLIRLAVASVLVKHVRGACLYLSIDNLLPKPLSLN